MLPLSSHISTSSFPPSLDFPPQTSRLQCGSTCRSPIIPLASQRRPRLSNINTPRHSHNAPLPSPSLSQAPPSYTLDNLRVPGDLHPANPDTKTSVLHPRVAVLLGVEKHWHFPLLFCRALSTAPAAWWGLRCALTFMGELLMEESLNEGLSGVNGTAAPWSVEKRFRVTEVFLAVLWVWILFSCCCVEE